MGKVMSTDTEYKQTDLVMYRIENVTTRRVKSKSV